MKKLLSFLKNQKGEIATTLTLVSLGLMVIGALVGANLVQEGGRLPGQASTAPSLSVEVTCSQITACLNNVDPHTTFDGDVHITHPQGETVINLVAPPQQEVCDSRSVALEGDGLWGHKWIDWNSPSWGSNWGNASWGPINCEAIPPTNTPTPTATATPTSTPTVTPIPTATPGGPTATPAPNLPDLTIEVHNLSNSNPEVGDDVTVDITVHEKNGVTVNEQFQYGVWVRKPDWGTACEEPSVQVGTVYGGGSFTLTFGPNEPQETQLGCLGNLDREGQWEIYTFVDNEYQIDETKEDNNEATLKFTVGTGTPPTETPTPTLACPLPVPPYMGSLTEHDDPHRVEVEVADETPADSEHPATEIHLSKETGYMQWSEIASWDVTSPGLTYTHQDTEIACGNTYRYKAIAVNDCGTTDSQISSIPLQACPAPPAEEGTVVVNIFFEDEKVQPPIGMWHVTDVEFVDQSPDDAHYRCSGINCVLNCLSQRCADCTATATLPAGTYDIGDIDFARFGSLFNRIAEPDNFDVVADGEIQVSVTFTEDCHKFETETTGCSVSRPGWAEIIKTCGESHGCCETEAPPSAWECNCNSSGWQCLTADQVDDYAEIQCTGDCNMGCGAEDAGKACCDVGAAQTQPTATPTPLTVTPTSTPGTCDWDYCTVNECDELRCAGCPFCQLTPTPTTTLDCDYDYCTVNECDETRCQGCPFCQVTTPTPTLIPTLTPTTSPGCRCETVAIGFHRCTGGCPRENEVCNPYDPNKGTNWCHTAPTSIPTPTLATPTPIPTANCQCVTLATGFHYCKGGCGDMEDKLCNPYDPNKGTSYCQGKSAAGIPAGLISRTMVDQAAFADGVVDFKDWDTIRANYGVTGSARGDVNRDGTVNAMDLSITLLHLGQE